MKIFLFNRKLMWAVVPLIFWSLLVLFIALEDEDSKQAGVGLKLERRGVRVPGRLISLSEDSEGVLSIELGIRKSSDGYAIGPDGQKLPELPEGISINYLVEEGQPRREAPRISLQSGKNEPMEFLRGNLRVLISERFAIRITRQGLQILPKDKGFDQQRFIQELLRRRDAGPDGAGRRGGMQEGQGREGPGRMPGPAPDEEMPAAGGQDADADQAPDG